jgi:hypothetical protein
MIARVAHRVSGSSTTSQFISAALGLFAFATVVGMIALAILPHYSSACELNDAKDAALRRAQPLLEFARPLYAISATASLVGLASRGVSGIGRAACVATMVTSGILGLFALFLWAFYPGMCS